MEITLVREHSEPLYLQLQKQLTSLIRTEQKTCGKMLSENFLAETCGISRMTARQALINLEREGFIYRVPGKGTFVREQLPETNTATSLQKKTITIYLSSFTSKQHPFFLQLLAGIEHQARISDLSVSLSSDFTNVCREQSLFGTILINRVPADEIHHLEKGKIPFVLMFEHRETYGRTYPSVLINNEKAIFTATEHLLKLGHKKIALFCGILNGHLKGEGSRKRLAGYKRALEQRNIPFDPSLVMESDYDEEKTRVMTGELLSLPHRPTAVIACDDIGAGIIINTLKEKGIHVPRDMAVIGVGDIPMNSVISPPLTTIRIPTFECGEKTVTCLSRAANGESTGSSSLMEGNLIIRKSCGWKETVIEK